jgi:hypothetical protein
MRRKATIVFGRDEDDAIRTADAIAESAVGIRCARRIGIEILVIERQMAGLDEIEPETFWRERREGQRHLPAGRVAAQAADEHGNILRILTHDKKLLSERID